MTKTQRNEASLLPWGARDFRSLIELPMHRPFHMIIPSVLVFATAIALAFTLPKRFRSSTQIMLEHQQVPDSVIPKLVTREGGHRLATIKQELLSRGRLERLIQETDPYPRKDGKPVPIGALVERLRADASITVKGDDSFTIEFVHRNPKKAQEVTNGLAQLFIEETAEEHQRQVAEANDFIQTQLAEARKELEEKETLVRRYKERNMGSLPTQLPANLSTLQRLQLEQQAVEENLRMNQERQASLQRSLAEHETGTAPVSGSPNDPVNELAQLRGQLAALRGRYTDEHPDVRAMQARVQQLEAEVASRPAGAAPPPVDGALRTQLAQAEGEVARLQTRRADIEQQLTQFQARVEQTPRIEQELLSLERDYQKLQENYLTLLKTKMDAELASSLEQRWKREMFKTLDPANLPDRPFFPNVYQFLLGGLVLGLMAGFGTCLAAEFLDASIKNRMELEALLPYPVLVTITHANPPRASSALLASVAANGGAATEPEAQGDL